MNAVSEDIKDLIVAGSSLGLTFASNLFCFREPPLPDNVVTIFDTVGDPPGLVLAQSDGMYEKPSIQIRIRWKDAREAIELGNDIVSFLHGHDQVSVNGAKYTMIKSVHPPYIMDWDENNRIRVALNFEIQRRAV